MADNLTLGRIRSIFRQLFRTATVYDLSDVAGGPASDGDVLRYSGADRRFVPSALPAGGASLEKAAVYLSATAGSYATVSTLPFDTVEISAAWLRNIGGEIELNAGTYLVMVDVTTDEEAGDLRTEFETKMQDSRTGLYVDTPGTVRRSYSRQDAQGAQSVSISTVLTFGVTSRFKILTKRYSGVSTGQWIAHGSSATILKIG